MRLASKQRISTQGWLPVRNAALKHLFDDQSEAIIMDGGFRIATHFGFSLLFWFRHIRVYCRLIGFCFGRFRFNNLGFDHGRDVLRSVELA